MHRQTRFCRPALISNTLWTNLPITSICITVFLWGTLNASGQLTALCLHDVRDVSALTSSLYFLPAPICRLLMNIAIGALLPHLRPSIAVHAGCLVSGIAPLLLAKLCRIDGPGYRTGVFQAMALNPLGADLMYTITSLVMTGAVPAKTQTLADGVLNMLSQVGKSVRIATSAVLARQVPGQAGVGLEAFMLGYRAGWLYNCSLGFVSVLVSWWGLKSVHKVGIKKD
ncbi:uncharacterized protein BO72DRAFT_444519 [Aspergillus fijiensis CBS 313.89]|uniref:MFS general substrate transporter n=1 Tax=Aspergillus fijiensis CBS 313.89 TaxID=1448319 RepID=A0A8G1RYU3_9EURO|nr:uncharacterized protein BO72DRAFT_444519 [Aspergillus fijiensis CBS 313.89]RAK81523.1 hypothetical protein BO72DRAFT_444519 [Aspergillus fijiensis CBS 313.89]